jgi:hypothetical protein
MMKDEVYHCRAGNAISQRLITSARLRVSPSRNSVIAETPMLFPLPRRESYQSVVDYFSAASSFAFAKLERLFLAEIW